MTKKRLTEVIQNLQKTINIYKDSPQDQDLVKSCQSVLNDLKTYYFMEKDNIT